MKFGLDSRTGILPVLPFWENGGARDDHENRTRARRHERIPWTGPLVSIMVLTTFSRKESLMTTRQSLAAILSLTLCFAFLPLGSVPCFGEDGKIATISLENVYKSSSRLKAAVEEVNKLRTEIAGKMATISNAARLIQSKLEKEKDTLKPEEKKKLDEELQAKRSEYETEEQNLRVKISFKQKSVQNVLKVQVPQVVEKIANQKGFTLVLWDQAIAYSKGVPDISADIAKELDQLPAPEKGPQDDPPAKQ